MKKVLKWVAIGFGVLLVIGIFASIGDESTETESVKTAEPAPKETKETPKLTPEEELTAAIHKVSKDAEVEYLKRTIQVVAPYPDNFTKGMRMTSAQMDAIDMLEAISKSELLADDTRVSLSFRAETTDKLGNPGSMEVVLAYYSAPLIRKINFENFNTENVFEIADDGSYVHPVTK